MKQELTIKRWGNSAGLPLSKALREHLQAEIGDKVEVCTVDKGLLIRAVTAPHYTLKELLSSCTRQNTRIDAEDVAWLHNPPVGREV